MFQRRGFCSRLHPNFFSYYPPHYLIIALRYHSHFSHFSPVSCIVWHVWPQICSCNRWALSEECILRHIYLSVMHPRWPSPSYFFEPRGHTTLVHLRNHFYYAQKSDWSIFRIYEDSNWKTGTISHVSLLWVYVIAWDFIYFEIISNFASIKMKFVFCPEATLGLQGSQSPLDLCAADFGPCINPNHAIHFGCLLYGGFAC